MEKMSITLNPENYKLVSDFSLYGFKNRDDAVNSALNLLNTTLNKQLLIQSAELYLEVYQNDKEIQELTEFALIDFRD